MSQAVRLELREASYSYGRRRALCGVSLRLQSGEFAALIGPNGSGKSTLLRLAAGLLRPTAGEVLHAGRRLDAIPARERARSVALVSQAAALPAGYRVAEWVLLGRTPYLGPLAGPSPADRQVAEWAMESTGVLPLAERQAAELSGGEQSRVALAAALCQQPDLLLLDEMTAHLDLAYQAELLAMVRRLSLDHGVTVLAALHDLNLAAIRFDRLVLLQEGQLRADGPPREVIQSSLIESVYGASVQLLPHPEGGASIVLPRGSRLG